MPGPPGVPPPRCPPPLDGGRGAPVSAGLPNLPPYLGANLSRAAVAYAGQLSEDSSGEKQTILYTNANGIITKHVVIT